MIKKVDVVSQVKQALLEDIGSGDVSAALIDSNLWLEAEILSREPLVLCGQAWVNEAFLQLSSQIRIHWHKQEGQWIRRPSVLATISGSAQAILTAERTALNFLQTLSGTATKTYRYVEAVQAFDTKILDTRKTIPGLRLAQKYAVRCGGGHNHRLGLYDAFLIKENHIKACGSIEKAIYQAKKRHPHLLVEVEVESITELEQALVCRPDRILLDNFSLPRLIEAVKINQAFKCPLEVSGGVNLHSIKSIAETGVDFISIGDLTKSIQAIDLSLLIRECR